MLEGQARNHSNESCSPSNLAQTSIREAGRELARIGDVLNEETLVRRSLDVSTIVLFLQLGDLRAVLTSVLIPLRAPFYYEAEISFFVFIVRFLLV